MLNKIVHLSMDKNIRNEAGISLAKSIFNAVPYVGGLLNEVAFDFRSRIKQERITLTFRLN